MTCYNQDLLFIHVPKCAGTAVRQYLMENLPDVKGPDDLEACLPIGHIRLADIQSFTGRSPESFGTILAVIRNPYDLMLSQWCYWRDRYARGDNKMPAVVAGGCTHLEEYLEDENCDYFVKYRRHQRWEPGQTREQQAANGSIHELSGETYQDAGGYFPYWLAVDGVIPGNVLVADIKDINPWIPAHCSLHGGPKDFQHIPQSNTSPHKMTTQDYYTPTAARIVEDKFQWAFAHHYTKWPSTEKLQSA